MITFMLNYEHVRTPPTTQKLFLNCWGAFDWEL